MRDHNRTTYEQLAKKALKEVTRHIESLKEILIFSPVTILKQRIDNMRWFEGVVLSAVFLEVYGVIWLKVYFGNKIDPQRIERLSLEQIIMFLYGLGIVNQDIYSKMMGIKNARNNLLHYPMKLLYASEAKKIIEKGIKCLEALVTS